MGTVRTYGSIVAHEGTPREMADAAWRGSTITDIAYHWGFSDAARFSRAFRDQFGVTPRRFRQTQIKQS